MYPRSGFRSGGTSERTLVPVFVLGEHLSADCKRGRRKGATSKNVKNRQKVSKSFSTLFDNFRAGQKTSKIVKKCQKVFRHFSTIFARHLFIRPLLHSAESAKTTLLETTLLGSLGNFEVSGGSQGCNVWCSQIQELSKRPLQAKQPRAETITTYYNPRRRKRFRESANRALVIVF